MDAEATIASVETSETRVYLDAVEPAAESASPVGDDSDPEEAAWRTAVEAAPYLLGDEARDDEVPPEEAFEKLKPFKA
jgi:hypothetical protein